YKGKEITMINLGERIKKLREKKKLTQKDLSKVTGLTVVQISRYETNERKPDPDALNSLVDALDTNADYLLGRTHDPSSSNQQTAPEWATTKDKRDIKRILEDDLPVMFDGMPVDEEDKQRITDLITGFLWEAKEKNKVTYGRKKKVETDQGDNEVK